MDANCSQRIQFLGPLSLWLICTSSLLRARIRIAGNPCLAERTKHFDVKYHWLREKIKANKVELRYVNTHEQLADIFTKPLGVMQHNYLKGRLTGFR